MTCDVCGRPIPDGTECTPGTRTVHEHCCPDCKDDPMTDTDNLPTPAMRSMDLRVIRLKAEAIEWRERAETAEAEVRRLRDQHTTALHNHRQETDMTDTGQPHPIDLTRELREALGLFAGAMPCTPEHAWGEAINVVKALVSGRCWKSMERDTDQPTPDTRDDR